MTGVQVYRPARIPEEEEIIHALGGLPPIGSRWGRRTFGGYLSNTEWIVTAHRDGVAIAKHTKHGPDCRCEGDERPMPVWAGSTWERVG